MTTPHHVARPETTPLPKDAGAANHAQAEGATVPPAHGIAWLAVDRTASSTVTLALAGALSKLGLLSEGEDG
jgi:hypothetical protein